LAFFKTVRTTTALFDKILADIKVVEEVTQNFIKTVVEGKRVNRTIVMAAMQAVRSISWRLQQRFSVFIIAERTATH
jgi:hypothetical protein